MFDDLSADADEYDGRAPSVSLEVESDQPSEQFDSPRAVSARSVADHRHPANGVGGTMPSKVTAPSETDNAAPSAKDAFTPFAGATAEGRLSVDDDDDEDLAPPVEAPMPEAPMREAPMREGPMREAPMREAPMREGPMREAPMREAPMREAPMREAPMREAGSMRAPRDSSLAVRDVPMRKPARREVTVRQAPPLPAAKLAWRDEIVFWTYEVFDGVVERGAPIASPLDDLAERFGVPDSVLPALVVLYGAHLAGERGVAPVHIARVLGSWDEALGRGLLAGRGLATFAESRVRLAGPIQRFLDEVPVETGALVGVPGTIALPGPHAVIAKAETPLKVVAVRWLAEVGGAILAAHDDADLAELFVEARARGAAPMFRIGADELLELGTDPAILVVTDEEIAESLGVPRLG